MVPGMGDKAAGPGTLTSQDSFSFLQESECFLKREIGLLLPVHGLGEREVSGGSDPPGLRQAPSYFLPLPARAPGGALGPDSQTWHLDAEFCHPQALPQPFSEA